MKKNILFIIYTHSLGGGAEKILTNIANRLDPEKYNIDILEYADYGVKEESIRQGITRCAPIVSMKKDGKIKRVWKNIQVYSYAGLLRRRKKRYDLEISFNYLIPTFLLSGKCPAIAWFHGGVGNLKRSPYYRWLQRRSLKKVARLVTISENTRDSVLEVYPETADRLEVIYNGFDLTEITKAGDEPCDIKLGTPSILYVGRLEEGKAPLVLLEVMRRLQREGKKVFLYYIGQGEKQGEIQEKIKEYELGSQVSLLGYQMNPYPLMKQSRAICMMSKNEGFPTVFAEGMSLGVPFISTPVGGVKELSDGGKCGRVVNSIEECAKAIEECVLDEEENRKMAEECLRHIRKFSLDEQIRQVEALIDEVTGD